jgi:transposase-like protein
VPKPITKKTEVIPSPENDQSQRRKFTAAQKARILAEADARERGQLSILLRREGIYSSQLGSWRAQQEQHGLEGLANSKPGPNVTVDAKDRAIEKLERRNQRLEKELRIATALIGLQKKLTRSWELRWRRWRTAARTPRRARRAARRGSPDEEGLCRS